MLGYMGGLVYASSTIALNWDIISGAGLINVTPNTWTHWAFVRTGNVLYSYRNGQLYGQANMVGILVDGGYQSVIGDYRTGDHSYFVGNIQEFRVSNVARWTANFTPPTEPYSPEINGWAKVGSDWKRLEKGFVKVGDSWRQLEGVKVKDSQWR